MRSWHIALLAVAAPLALIACGGSTPPPSTAASETPAAHDEHAEHHEAAAPAPASADLKPIGEAKIGDKTNCPVSGEEFVVAESSPKVEHDGKTYYFCCPGCAKKFQADPQKYLTKKPGG
jgi:YHS domain-containing protein